MLEISTSPENPMEKKTPQSGTGTAASYGGPVSVSDGFKPEEHGEEEEGDRNSTANRWPRDETMALLKIRSEMDVAFKDISPKAPLWEQVSRKLGELGYHRSAKKCKEKFENIYKYHRRTKEGRSGRTNGKTYRFFEQLEALDNNQLPLTNSSSSSLEGQVAKTTTTTYVPNNVNVIQDAVPCSIRFPSENMVNVDHNSSSTNSSTSEGSREGKKKKKKKKKKLRHFFEGLMREVIENQETLQRKFMEVLDKCEKERTEREEAWKVEELARIKGERELLAQERSIAAARDEAVLALLKKFTENAAGTVVHLPERVMVTDEKEKQENDNVIVNVNNNGGSVSDKQACGENVSTVGSFMQMSSSRWPQDEVEALIRLRTQMDLQCQGNGSKGSLWEEISSAMKSLGYDRSAKRCKEKWENINKYFKRMKEKNKRKPAFSKTCPYYDQLEALYSKKPKKLDESSGGNSRNELKPEELLIHIMSGQEESQQIESSSEDADRENMDQNQQGSDNEDGYQIVANGPSIAIMG